MAIPHRSTFWEYRDLFRELMQASLGAERAAEQSEAYIAATLPPLDERLIQTVWAQQLLEASGLRTVAGEPLRVLDPGRWNGSAGPDFKGAKLMLGNRTLTGDVELHLDPADWIAHAHHRDLDYNAAVLHVVLNNPDGRPDDPLHNGGRVPRLELEPYLFPDLETLRRSLTPDDYQYLQPEALGRCHRLMSELDAALIADFLDRAGDERLESKAARLADQARDSPLDQVFHQALLMAMGSGPGRTLYYLLAKRTPVAELLDEVRPLDSAQWPVALESILLNVAGLALTPEALAPKGTADFFANSDASGEAPEHSLSANSDVPEESISRAAQLAQLWQKFAPYWSDRAIPSTRRWFQGIRPVNFPTRRLAGIATLLARALHHGETPLADLIGRIRQGTASLEGAQPTRRRHPLLDDLIQQLTVEPDGHFWGTHYSFTAKPAARPMTLIGESTALSLVFNAVLPMALLVARRDGDRSLEEATRTLFALVPPLQSNHITDFMTRRLFGQPDKAAHLFTTERRRQALFQIFYHCCNSETAHCDACHYLAR